MHLDERLRRCSDCRMAAPCATCNGMQGRAHPAAARNATVQRLRCTAIARVPKIVSTRPRR
eukprot:6173752-Pleurochrysis_carterae.AAC.5